MKALDVQQDPYELGSVETDWQSYCVCEAGFSIKNRAFTETTRDA
jgi:hypothetical protein